MLPVGTKFDLFLTFVKADGQWLKVCGQMDTKLAEEIAETLVQLEPSLENRVGLPHPVDVHVNEKCLAKFDEDGKWYRARITSLARIASGQIEVNFLDYGNAENVALTDIRKVEDSRLMHLPLATEFIIDGIIALQGAWSDEVIAFIQDNLYYEVVSVHVVGSQNATPKIEIICPSFENNSLAKLLQDRGLAKPSLRKDYPLLDFSVGFKCSVYVSHIESLSKFWIQLVDNESALNDWMASVETYATAADAAPCAAISVEQPCITTFSEDCAFYRARIVQITDGQPLVTFVDFGNSEVKMPTELVQIPDNLTAFPAQAVECCMNGSERMKNKADIIASFTELTLSKPVVCTVIAKTGQGAYIVNLEDEGVNLFTLLTVPLVEEFVPALKYAKLVFSIAEGYEIKISHVETASHFYCNVASQSQQSLIDDLMNRMEELLSTGGQPINAKECVPGLPCCVKYSIDDLWYRAEILEVVLRDGTVKVHYVDYGNSEVVPFDRVRKLASNFVRELPAQAVECRLTNANELVGLSPDILEEMTDEKVLVVKVNSVENEIMIVDLFDMNSNPFLCINEVLKTRMAKDSRVIPSGPEISRHARSVIVPFPNLNAVEKIYVLVVDEAGNFFGQLERFDMDELETFQSHLTEYYTSSGECLYDDQRQHVGDYCCTDFSEDQQFYRGKIVSEDLINGTALVLFIDYGNSEVKPFAEIRKLVPQYAAKEQQGILCHLADYPLLQSEVLSPILSENTLELKIISVTAQNVYQVSLTTGDTNRKVNEQLGAANALVPTRGRNLALRSYTKPPLMSEEEVIVTHRNSPLSLMCQLQRSQEVLLSLMDEIDHHGKSLGSMNGCLKEVVVGSPCLAQYVDDTWYRAQITTAIGPAKTIVQYVDFGNSEEVLISAVKAIPDNFMVLPRQCIECALVGVQKQTDWTAEQLAELDKVTMEQNLIASFTCDPHTSMEPYTVMLMDETRCDILTKIITITDPLVPTPHMTDADDGGWDESESNLSSNKPKSNFESKREPWNNQENKFNKFGNRAPDNTGWNDSAYGAQNQGFDRSNAGSGFRSGNKFARNNGGVGEGSWRDTSWRDACVNRPNNGGFRGSNGGGSNFGSGYGQNKRETESFGGKRPGFAGSSLQKNEDNGSSFGNRSQGFGSNAPRSGFGAGNNNTFNKGNDSTSNGWDQPSNRSSNTFGNQKGFGSRDDKGFGSRDDKGFGSRDDKGFGSRDDKGFGSRDDKGFGSRDDKGFGSRDDKGFGSRDDKGFGSRDDKGFGSRDDKGFGSRDIRLSDQSYDRNKRSNFGGSGSSFQQKQENGFSSVGNRSQVFGSVNPPAAANEDDWDAAPTSAPTPVPTPRFGSESKTAQGGSFGKSGGSDESSKGFGSGKTRFETKGFGGGFGGPVQKSIGSKGSVESLDSKSNEQRRPVNASIVSTSMNVKKSGPFYTVELEKGQFKDISVVYIVSPTEFYIHLVELSGKLQMVMDSIAKRYQLAGNSEMRLHNARTDTPCCAKYHEDNMWYRAKITAVHGTSVEVLFVDYGNTEIVPLTNVKELQSEFLDFPAQALQCALENTRPTGDSWSHDDVEKFRLLTHDKCFVAYVVNHLHNGTIEMKLIEPRLLDEIDVSRELVSMGHGRFAALPPTHSRVTTTTYVEPVIDNGAQEEVLISWVASPAEFYCHLTSSKVDLDAMMERMQRFFQSAEGGSLFITNWQANSPCVAKFTEDNVWYRALVQEIDGDSVTVFYVDFGNKEKLLRTRIRANVPEYMSLPTQAIKCSLRDVKPIGDNWKSTPQQTLEAYFGTKGTCTFYASFKGFYLVDFQVDGKSVAAQLVTDGLASVNSRPSSFGSIASCDRASMTLNDYLSPFSECDLPWSPGDFLDVIISGRGTTNSFWCQLVSGTDKRSSLSAQLQEIYSNLSAADLKFANPTRGTACVVMSAFYGYWLRAVVESRPSPSKVHVFLVDVGHFEDIPIKKCKMMKDDLLCHPVEAFCCSLYDVPNNVDGVRFSDLFMTECLNKEFVAQLMSKNERCVYEVKLFSLGDDEVEVNLCDVLLEKYGPVQQAEPVEEHKQQVEVPNAITEVSEETETSVVPPETTDFAEILEESKPENLPILRTFSDPSALTEQYPEHCIKVHEKFLADVVHIGSPGLFWIHVTTDQDKLTELADSLAEQYGSGNGLPLTGDELQSGNPCIAQYAEDECWYRGTILAVEEEAVHVHFIDYGNSDSVVPALVCRPAPELVTIPSLALQCELANVTSKEEDWTAEAIEEFETLVMDKSLTVEVIRQEGRKYHVRLLDMGLDVATSLASKGFTTLDCLSPLLTTVISSGNTLNDKQIGMESTDLEPENEDGLAEITHRLEVESLNDSSVQIENDETFVDNDLALENIQAVDNNMNAPIDDQAVDNMKAPIDSQAVDNKMNAPTDDQAVDVMNAPIDDTAVDIMNASIDDQDVDDNMNAPIDDQAVDDNMNAPIDDQDVDDNMNAPIDDQDVDDNMNAPIDDQAVDDMNAPIDDLTQTSEAKMDANASNLINSETAASGTDDSDSKDVELLMNKTPGNESDEVCHVMEGEDFRKVCSIVTSSPSSYGDKAKFDVSLDVSNNTKDSINDSSSIESSSFLVEEDSLEVSGNVTVTSSSFEFVLPQKLKFSTDVEGDEAAANLNQNPDESKDSVFVTSTCDDGVKSEVILSSSDIILGSTDSYELECTDDRTDDSIIAEYDLDEHDASTKLHSADTTQPFDTTGVSGSEHDVATDEFESPLPEAGRLTSSAYETTVTSEAFDGSGFLASSESDGDKEDFMTAAVDHKTETHSPSVCTAKSPTAPITNNNLEEESNEGVVSFSTHQSLNQDEKLLDDSGTDTSSEEMCESEGTEQSSVDGSVELNVEYEETLPVAVDKPLSDFSSMPNIDLNTEQSNVHSPNTTTSPEASVGEAAAVSQSLLSGDLSCPVEHNLDDRVLSDSVSSVSGSASLTKTSDDD